MCFTLFSFPPLFFITVFVGITPEFNVGNHQDFGRLDSPLVEQLTWAEQQVIAKTIRFQSCVKFSGDVTSGGVVSVTGHVIAFAHTGSSDLFATTTLPRADLQGVASVVFCGETTHWSAVTARGSARRRFLEQHHSLVVDLHRVYRCLRLLQACNRYYSDIVIDDTDITTTALSSLTDALLDGALVVSDPTTVAVDRAARANVARPDDMQVDAAPGVGTLEHSFVAPPVQSRTPDVVDVLAATRRALTVTADAADPSALMPPPTIVSVSDAPVNEFVANDVFFLGGFPWLFLLGQGLQPDSGTLSRREIEHLLLQFDGRFAKCPAFLFSLFNQLQRHAAARDVSLRVKANHAAMHEFVELVNSPDFSSHLQHCLDQPLSRAARALSSKITNLARLTGSDVPWSPLQRRQALPRVLALMQYAGPASFFVTFAPPDMDSYLLLRLSHTTTNHSWDFSAPLPSLAQRKEMLASNPVAAAEVYQRLVRCLFSHLVGLSPAHTTRTAPPPVCERPVGILGIPVAFAGVTEVQGRQSAHGHYLVWCDVSPTVVQQFLDSPVVRTQVSVWCSRRCGHLISVVSFLVFFLFYYLFFTYFLIFSSFFSFLFLFYYLIFTYFLSFFFYTWCSRRCGHFYYLFFLFSNYYFIFFRSGVCDTAVI